MKCLASIVLGVWLPVLPASLDAQENPQEAAQAVSRLKTMSIEDLMEVKVDTVYAAARHEQTTTEAPASAS